MRLLLLSLASFCAISSVLAADYYPPDARFGVYGANTIQGVVGGIPSRSGGTQVYATDYGWAEGNTAAENTTAINAALNACPVNGVVHLPAGTYNFNGVTLSYDRNNRTVRGAGNGAGGTTLVVPNGVKAFQIGSGSANFGNVSNRTANITGGVTRGSTELTVDNSGLYRGFRQLYLIAFENEVVTPIVVTNARDGRSRSLIVAATAQSGSSLTLSQPLPSSYAAAIAEGNATIVEAFPLNWLAYGIGIEDIYFDCTAHAIGSPVDSALVSYADNCWVKGVTVDSGGNYALAAKNSINVEITGCELIGASGGTSRGGLFLTVLAYSLIEDNYVSGAPSLYAWISCVNNVIGYNYFGAHVNANHNVWASHNLYEGNVWSYLMSDGFFGGSSEDTLFRNYGRSSLIASLKRLTRNYNIIANMAGVVGVTTGDDNTAKWGLPNLGNESSTGTTAQPSSGSWWTDWDSSTGAIRKFPMQLTSRASDGRTGVATILDPSQGDAFEAALAESVTSYNRQRNAFGMQFLYFGTRSGDTWEVDAYTANSTKTPLSALDSTSDVISGPGGFQQKDLDVLGTAIMKANWYVVHSNAIKSGEELADGETLPASYYRTSKPAWFGSLPWPAYDPLNPGTPDAERIPAGYRYINGTEDYMGPSAPSFSAHPATQTATVGDNVTLTVAGGGNPSPTLQWRKGGVNISGATSSSLVLSNVQLSDAGSYDCVATNSEGAATSNAAVLTVNAAPSEGGTATIQTLNVTGSLNIQ